MRAGRDAQNAGEHGGTNGVDLAFTTSLATGPSSECQTQNSTCRGICR
jgi:hypothetical protein